MDDLKPWHIVLIVAAIGVLGFSVWRFGFAGAVDQPRGFMTVDVTTGQLYDIRLGKAKGMMLPAKNPDTGERVLYPVIETGDGWQVSPSYLEDMPKQDRSVAKAMRTDGSVDVLPDKPIEFVLRK